MLLLVTCKQKQEQQQHKWISILHINVRFIVIYLNRNDEALC